MIFPGEDFVVEAPCATPLYSACAAASEANIWTAVNGWSAPRLFTSLSAEYEAAKRDVAMADFGALAHYALRGGEAPQFLSRLTTAPAATLALGESARGLILTDDGFVIDLAEVSRLSEELFLLTTPSPHWRRIQLAARGIEVSAEDISGDIAALGVFGPRAGKALAAAGLKSPNEAVASSAMLRGVETAARPIQFGALPGVELIFPKAEALIIWERLLRRGEAAPIGLDALEALRIESGAPRPGVDFRSAETAPPGQARRPQAIGLAHLAPLNRGWFNGRRGLRRAGDEPASRLVTLAIDADVVAPGAALVIAGRVAGKITSCAWSPSAKCVVAFADVSLLSGENSSEISVLSDSGQTLAARPLATAESALAEAFQKS